MSTYFNNQEDLKKLDNLIDNDTTIVKDMFKKQLIHNYSDYKADLETFTTSIDYNYESFYNVLKDLLIKNNEFVTTVGNYIISEKVGTEKPISQFEAEDNINKKTTKLIKH